MPVPALPRPRLRPLVPILDRGPGELQLGSTEGLVLHAPRAVLRRALALIDGRHDVRQIAAESGLEVREVRQLVTRLAAAGLLAPASPATPPLVRVLGAGFLARAFAEAYAESAVGELLLVEPGPPRGAAYDIAHLHPTGAETLRAHLRARGHQGIRTASHWYRPEGPSPDLTVIAFDRPECDRAVTDVLVRGDQPHLFLRPCDDGIVVGPFVVPGQTCCTRCMDLVRARDRAWPLLLAQLCGLDQVAPHQLTAWGAGLALLQVRAWLAGEHPETLGATLEVRSGRWTIEQRRWPHHPDCGCAELRLTG